MLVCSCGKCREKKSSETVTNTEKGADDESEEGEESDGRETGNSKSDIKTESEENKESSSIPNTVQESLQKQQCHFN